MEKELKEQYKIMNAFKKRKELNQLEKPSD
jgi:hypothetical protein